MTGVLKLICSPAGLTGLARAVEPPDVYRPMPRAVRSVPQGARG